jgi:hypothetical protein
MRGNSKLIWHGTEDVGAQQNLNTRVALLKALKTIPGKSKPLWADRISAAGPFTVEKGPVVAGNRNIAKTHPPTRTK